MATPAAGTTTRTPPHDLGSFASSRRIQRWLRVRGRLGGTTATPGDEPPMTGYAAPWSHALENIAVTTSALYRPRQPERRRRRRFRLVERRSGFERRRLEHPGPLAALLLHLRDHPALVLQLLVAVNLLSILDLVITRRIMSLGAIELNPLMAHLLAQDATSAAGVKIALVGAGTFAIWRLCPRRPALLATLLLLAIFALLIAYESILLAA
jgi:hypothetical protein